MRLILSLLFISVFFISQSQPNSFKVLLFYSTDCPICINYIPSINKIDSLCLSMGADFEIILPSQFDKKDANRFNNKYKQHFNFILDKKNKYISKFKATVTPQVFLIDSEKESVLYGGAIDDLNVSIGKRKEKVQNHYLFDAINSFIQHTEIETKYTQAIGCLIR